MAISTQGTRQFLLIRLFQQTAIAWINQRPRVSSCKPWACAQPRVRAAFGMPPREADADCAEDELIQKASDHPILNRLRPGDDMAASQPGARHKRSRSCWRATANAAAHAPSIAANRAPPRACWVSIFAVTRRRQPPRSAILSLVLTVQSRLVRPECRGSGGRLPELGGAPGRWAG